MSFVWPIALLALLLIPLGVAGYVLAQRQRRRYAIRFTNLDLLGSVVSESPAWRRHVPVALFLLALAALVVAVARPQRSVAEERQQATVMMVTDISGSMQANDVKPSRLAAAQQAASGFVDQLPERYRLGLIAFSSTADLLVPATTERDPVQEAIALLSPQGGTAMGDALQGAVNQLAPIVRQARARGDQRPPASILLLSDGADTLSRGSTPTEAARAARRLRIPVYTIALGTDKGRVTATDPATGLTQRIEVPPDRETLRKIARTTRGRSFNAPTAKQLASVYRSIGARITTPDKKKELTAGFAGGGLVLLVIAGVCSLLWFGRLP